MAHATQHPHNPCSLNYNEEKAAKIWELLRRNQKFARAVYKLQKLDLDEKANGFFGLNRVSYRIVDALKRHNDFAAHALQWLVPDPEFLAYRLAAPNALDSQGRVELDVIAEGRGTTPDPEDHAHWSWEDLTRGPRGAIGENFYRGPVIFRQICADPRFCSKFDPFQEWREYFEVKKRKFTLATAWRDSPLGFRRAFCWLWRLRDSRAVSPDAGLRHDAPEPFEANLFLNWQLGKALLHCCKTGQMNLEDFGAFFQFQELAEDYRVFAIPKHIPSRMAAREMADWLYEKLVAIIPLREQEYLGTPLQWDIFLTVEDLMREESTSFEDGLQESFEKLHLHFDKWKEGQAMPDEKKRWDQRGADWQNSYRVIHSPVSGTGLIQQIFPLKPSFI